MWHQPTEMALDPRLSEKSTRKTKSGPGDGSSVSDSLRPRDEKSWENTSRKALIRILITQAFLTLGRKMPTSQEEGTLFLDGWENALKTVPTDSLKDAFSEAIASGKSFTPGLVVQSYREKIGIEREEIKRSQPSPDDRPFPYHAKLRQIGTDRPYSFALKEPAVCLDCGRPAEVFKCGSHQRKIFFCAFHGEGLSYPEVSSQEIPF